jgi:hypothetical protein
MASLAQSAQGDSSGTSTINLAPGIAAGWGTDNMGQILQEWGYPGATGDINSMSIPWTPPATFPGTYAGQGLTPGAVAPTPSTGPNPVQTTGTPYTPASTAAPTSTAATCPTCSTAPASSILYNCQSANNGKDYIQFPSLLGVGGGGLLSPCNAKAFLGATLVIWGSAGILIGLGLAFSRSKGLLGKSAQIAGAATAMIPGGEALGAGIAKAGKQTSTAAKATQASQHVVKQRQARQSAAATAQTVKQKASLSDELDAAHGQGVLTGRAQGRQTSTLKPTVARQGGGARYSDLGGGEF